jgi:hypothetical protein
MTEEWWRRYKDNKTKSENKLFTELESDLKKKFKNEKQPDDMFTICKTDNNYWRHYRWSENLDPDSVSLVLCRDYGCDLMYCQALTHQGKDKTYGCVEQYNVFRDCYVKEKRKFSSIHSDNEWLSNKTLIPEYIDKQLALMKEQKERVQKYGEVKVVKIDNSKLMDVPKKKEEMDDKEGYF